MKQFDNLKKTLGLMPEFKTLEEAKAFFIKRNEEVHGAYYDYPDAVHALEEWERHYRPTIAGSIKSKNFGLFFDAITSLDMPDERGVLSKEAKEAIPSMIALITRASEAKKFAKKAKETCLHEPLLNRWNELSSSEIEDAKTTEECRKALADASPCALSFHEGVKKLVRLATNIKELKDVVDTYGPVLTRHGRYGHSKCWDEVMVLVGWRAEEILLSTVKGINSIEEISLYYDLLPKQSLGHVACIKRWAFLCKDLDQARNLIKRTKDDDPICRLIVYNELLPMISPFPKG
jgi:hypothetical protein